MTEDSGDEAAADHARSLVDLVRRASMEHAGQLVKMLGDGAMLHFVDASAAVRCGLELVERVSGAGLPPARVGVNAGPLIQRDGDYFGRTVNIAARVADYARPNEVLATAEAVRGVSSGIEFAQIGEVSLKGVADPVELYTVRRASNR
jgi:adenylate cyclase